MKLVHLIVISLVLLALSTHSLKTRVGDKLQEDMPFVSCNSSSSCPTWFSCNANKKCRCKSGHDIVLCDETKMLSAVPTCRCVTFDSNTGDVFAGACIYTCGVFVHNQFYHILPQNMNASNFPICSSFHRTGILCGDCDANRSNLVLSYDLTCVECPHSAKNWWKFFLFGFGPLTLFCLFVALFNINVTSSHLHGVVCFSQIVSMPQFIRVLLLILKSHPLYFRIVKFTLPFYSLWNLDVFRSLFPPICLNISMLQAFALEYSIALYPLFLIFVFYVTISLHDSRVYFVTCCWKPFESLFVKLRRKWDIRTSVIDSFATFFLLSYAKMLSVTLDILIASRVYKLSFDSTEVSYRLFYSPSVIFFGTEHLPYAIVALVISFLFIVIPTFLLIAYTFQCFHNLLSCFQIRLTSLHTFVDSFQGCFKDGTEPGVCDYRWLSVVRLLIRVAFFIVYAMTLGSMFFVYANIVLLTVTMLFIATQPFKKATVKYPVTDTVFFILMSLFFVVCSGYDVETMTGNMFFPMTVIALGYLSFFSPLVYTLFLVLHWFITKTKLLSGLRFLK